MQNILSVLEPRLCGKSQQAACIDAGKLVTFLNPYSYLIARKNVALFSSFDLICIDGIALLLLLRLCGFRIQQRISFDYTSLAHTVFTAASTQKKSIFFVGSRNEVIRKFAAHIQEKYPDLAIYGFSGGYFSSDATRAETLDSIAQKKPDIVVCGMGTPLQERFLIDLRTLGWAGIGYTCGGFIQQTASANGLYFPHWIDRLHLRALYRLYKAPALWRRYIVEYPKIVPVLLQDALHAKNTLSTIVLRKK